MRNPEDKVFLYRRLAEEITELIRKDSLKPGDFLPPERVLSARFGAAFLTVRRALSLLVREGLIRKIPRQGSVLARTPDPVGAPGKKRVGITVWLEAGADHPVTLGRLSIMGEEFPSNLYEIVVIFITRAMIEKNDWSALLGSGAPDGLLLTVQEIPGHILDTVRLSGRPAVFLGLQGRAPGRGTDDRAGMSLLLDYLAGMGHRKIAFITRDTANCPGVSGQINIFQRLCMEKGLSGDVTAAHDYNESGGYLNTLARLKAAPPPSAVIYGDDIMAAGGFRALAELGLSCPRDMSVAAAGEARGPAPGFPALTSLRTGPENSPMRQCARLLRKILEDGPAEKDSYEAVVPELVVRGSTAPPQTGGRAPRPIDL
jgi:LacI family transcriptional regulator